MNNPGDYSLCDLSISSALSAVALTPIQNLEGMVGATIDFRFAYGAGGTSCRVWVQVTSDDGLTWKDIACRAFETASDTKSINVSGLTPITDAPVTPTDGAMADNTAQDGMLGSAMRVKITSVGFYSNTILSVRVNAR